MERRTALKGVIAAAALAGLAACAQDTGPGSIAEIAAGNDDFSTLVAAASAAGLVETLDTGGPFTVFAPTNAAFAALPAGTVESLLLPENKDQLTSILLYHVVPGTIQSGDVLGSRVSVATVEGSSVTVDGRVGKFGSGVRVNDANVISADILASNGVIHVIDKVLLP